MKLKRWTSGALVAVAMVSAGLALSACAGGSAPGVFNGLGDDYMAMLIIYRTDNKPLTYAQYLAVQDVAKDMNIQIRWQLSSSAESMVTAGAANAAAGAIGGASQALFYAGALAAPAAGYTATVYGLGGVVNGAQTNSYANDYAEGQMTEQALRDREDDGQTIFHHLHAVAALVRSRNNINSPAPDLAAHMPDWNGPQAGTTDQH